MKFTKMHGAGNDYIYIDAANQDEDWPALSVAMSDRHKGIGADGIILSLPSDNADLRMRMFNADGSEGKMCGNGIRCLVAFALKRGIVPRDTSPVIVETLSEERVVTPVWINDTVVSATVEMGEPTFSVDEIPVIAPGHEMLIDYPLEVNGWIFDISCVSMGNPHAVVFLDQPIDEIPLHEIGPQIDQHTMFPEGVNFEIANVLSDDSIRVRVWERGSGLTMACGTGACAVAAISRLKRLSKSDVNVSLPGGDLQIHWDGPGNGQVIMKGPVQEVFNGLWPDQAR